MQIRLLPAVLLFTGLSAAQTSLPVDYTPLTAAERRDHFVHRTFLSPALYFAALSAAGVEQLSNDPPEWGQGVGGYAHRAGSTLAALAIQSTVAEGGSAILHYDPRYLRCDCSNGAHRFFHAIAWSFVTKNDAGQTRPNAPLLAGAYAGGMIPFLWYPSRYSPWKDGFRNGSQQFGYAVGLNVLREFAPELRRAFHLKTP